MKNILLITNIYPMPDKSYTGTPVCHYFTKEWLEMGYNIKVVHFITRFPKLYYLFGKLFGDKIKAKTGNVVFTNVPRSYKKYILDGIPIILMPLFKFIPHTSFKKRIINKALEKIYREFEEENFTPDIITGHFALPQLQILHLLKEKYSNSQTCLVLHSDGNSIPKIYPEYKTYFESVNVWGFRSEAFRKSFESNFGEQNNSFICYSGIPKEFINENIKRDFSNGINHFSFLGSLYKLKRVDDTIKSLKNVFRDASFRFDIIGDGAERGNIEGLIKELDLKDKVKLYGEVKRDKAQEILAESQCFIMVSSREAFGLVYVEAMAKGCITIGTKGQGIDGVIKHGENGFLCNSSNVEELTNLIRNIINLPNSELVRISTNAIKTAKNLTDRKVAEHYINSVINAK